MITFSKGLLLYMEIRKELGMFVRGAVVAIIALKYTCVSSYGIKKYIRNISIFKINLIVYILIFIYTTITWIKP